MNVKEKLINWLGVQERNDTADEEPYSGSGSNISPFSSTSTYLAHTFEQIAVLSPDLTAEITQVAVEMFLTRCGILQNIIKYPAEDATKHGFYVCTTDVDKISKFGIDKFVHEQNEAIQSRCEELKVGDKLAAMIRTSLAAGSSFLYMDVNTKTYNNISSKELDIRAIKKINHINIWDRYMVREVGVDRFLTSPSFNEIMYYVMKDDVKYDKSRIKHMSIAGSDYKVFGTSLIVTLEEALDAQKTLTWSIGEIAHSMLFKVFKTGNVDFTKKKQYMERVKWMRKFLVTNEFIAIGKDEEMEFKTPGDLPRIKEMSDILWEQITAVAGIPKSILIGKTEGKVAGAEYDHLSYYMRLVALQENHIRPVLEWIVSGLFSEMGMPEEPFKVVFRPPQSVSAELDALIRKQNSEIELNTMKAVEIMSRVKDLVTPEEYQQYVKELEGGVYE